SIAAGIEVAEVIAVEKVDFPFLACAKHQMGMSCAAHGVRQENRSARTKISVIGSQGGLVKRREIIRHGQTIGRRKPDETIAIFSSVDVSRIEHAIAGHEE